VNEDSINVRIEANASQVTSGMAAAAGSVKTAVGQMNEALSTLKGSSSAATTQVVEDLGNRLPTAASQTNMALSRIGASVGAQRQGMQILAYQINDVSTQFAMGTNPMMIFAQQGNQVIQALNVMRGTAGGLVGFLAGPWGSAILGAASILGVMISTHQSAAEKQNDQTDATKDLTTATRELNEATKREITTTQASIQTNINQANALRQRAIAARQAALAEIELERSKLQSAQSSLGNMPSKGTTEIVGGQMASATAAISRLNEEIARQNQNIARTEQSIRGNRGLQIQQQVREETDASAAATGRYERRVYALSAALVSGRISEQAYHEEMSKATNARTVAEEAARAADRGSKGIGRSSGGRGSNGGNQMSQFDDMLTAQRNAHARLNEQNNTFYDFSKQVEANFWQQLLSLQTLSHDERLQIEQRYLAASASVRQDDFQTQVDGLRQELDMFQNNQTRRLEIATEIAEKMKAKYGEASSIYAQAQDQVTSITQAAAQQQIAVTREIADAQRQASLDAVNDKSAQVDLMTQLGLISQSDALQREIEFENERFQINFQALQERLAMATLDPDKNPIEYQRIKNEILAVERDHQMQVAQLNRQRVVEGQQTQLTFVNSLSQSWGQTLAQMAVGAKSFSSGIVALYQGMVGAIVQALTQMVAKWIAQQIAAFILTKIMHKTTAAGQIQASAGVAGAAAFASTAAIPVVGPALAPAAAAAAVTGALSFLPLALASAEGGYDIPAGVNPITQLHQREMVLPAEQADVIRSMAGNDVFTNASGGVTIHVSALDGHSVRRLFMDNKSELVTAIKAAMRDGVR
jgi:hypothetical protein